MLSTAAFVLVGGNSSRMGQDKSRLVLGGLSLLERAIHTAKAASQDVRLLGAVREETVLQAIPDRFPGCGPLAGIDAALATTSAELNFILSVDTPFIPALFVRHLLARAQTETAMVTYPRLRSGYQPLCAVYRRDFGLVAETALRKGEYKIDPLFSRVPACIIDDEELRKLGFGKEIFDNLNTPEDWERAQQRLRI
ncbi:MAG TPA: molybdenum cofactor guanylyltransferase [Terriglobales bacterium]|jgi:molybdopterin-guanine dinucleotide biosynthesis protein A|nr:molybdenum cofactor guanylyltransferase [Terriglobales bacterium]